ncbi:MAG: APC family permease [Nitrososphaerota archaeon]|nr:APC family permease [Nitrososphaerota archaeon]
MSIITELERSTAYVFKLLTTLVGLVVVVVSLGYLFNEYSYLQSQASASIVDIVTIIAIFGTALSGIALIASFANALRARFPTRKTTIQVKPTYGFGTLLAVGLGATLGSPLFILIPLNIMQYEFVSLGSLVLATILSVLMAKVYADMYEESLKFGLDALGGPSFTKVACGTRSVRYFISRLSMWVANTALAAYSKIVFVVFDFELMPPILSAYGISGVESQVIVWSITGVFIAWTVLNALFEQRLLKLIGRLQIVLTAVMVAILVYQSYALGIKGSWNLSGIFNFGPSANMIAALVINTGYLYLLFFGFQEIQALERDALETSSIPIVSWISRNYRMSKSKYLGIAMVFSVLIAAAINILYGLAVFSLHPDLSQLLKSQIPALYLAQSYLGSGQELLIAIAFLIATITTFVPAFLAASRHLGALAEDGFMPISLAKLSYVFTLAAILILAEGNQEFLVDVTDFLVLISLGVISLSAIWLRKRLRVPVGLSGFLPFLVGASCFVAGAAIYFISPSVAVFGSVSIVVAYLIYDIYELGSLGSQLFLGVLNLVVYMLLAFYPHAFAQQSFFLFQWLNLSFLDTGVLSFFLILTSGFLFANALLDYRLSRQSLTRRREALKV